MNYLFKAIWKFLDTDILYTHYFVIENVSLDSIAIKQAYKVIANIESINSTQPCELLSLTIIEKSIGYVECDIYKYDGIVSNREMLTDCKTYEILDY